MTFPTIDQNDGESWQDQQVGKDKDKDRGNVTFRAFSAILYLFCSDRSWDLFLSHTCDMGDPAGALDLGDKEEE